MPGTRELALENLRMRCVGLDEREQSQRRHKEELELKQAELRLVEQRQRAKEAELEQYNSELEERDTALSTEKQIWDDTKQSNAQDIAHLEMWQQELSVQQRRLDEQKKEASAKQHHLNKYLSSYTDPESGNTSLNTSLQQY